jgi:hypothetical protein
MLHIAIEFGMEPIVLDHIAAVPVEQGEQPPECGRQATRFASDLHDMPSPVDVPGLVEIVGKRDLLAASIAKEQRLRTTLSIVPVQMSPKIIQDSIRAPLGKRAGSVSALVLGGWCWRAG